MLHFHMRRVTAGAYVFAERVRLDRKSAALAPSTLGLRRKILYTLLFFKKKDQVFMVF